MSDMILRLTLRSAATFGRGDGVAGLIDREIEHDQYGFPYLRGKTLKGLLAESAENVVYALEQQGHNWRTVKDQLFGRAGRGLEERGTLHVGDACLPLDLRRLLQSELANRSKELTPDDILYSLTGIRRQTAMNPDGGPERGTLRSMRVLLRGVTLESKLSFEVEPTGQEKLLLAATVLDFRHAGTGRNRGRGWLRAELNDGATARALFDHFAQAVKP
jgi:CRISPR/Cas system CSM-associated protein Csm3 (group 7 of RAMP superfamily)